MKFLVAVAYSHSLIRTRQLRLFSLLPFPRSVQIPTPGSRRRHHAPRRFVHASDTSTPYHHRRREGSASSSSRPYHFACKGGTDREATRAAIRPCRSHRQPYSRFITVRGRRHTSRSSRPHHLACIEGEAEKTGVDLPPAPQPICGPCGEAWGLGTRELL